ncbi:UNVERIFIED_CONTAM: hypothetical protein HDU68_003786, partial [Siphonaria sp. JEL0065]
MLSSNDIEAGICEVQLLCPELRSDDIRTDLELSGSVEATINRVFDSLFLVGTRKDPSLALLSQHDELEFRKVYKHPQSPIKPPSSNFSSKPSASKQKKPLTICISSDSDDADVIDLRKYVKPTSTFQLAQAASKPKQSNDEVVVIYDSDEDVISTKKSSSPRSSSYSFASHTTSTSFTSTTTTTTVKATEKSSSKSVSKVDSWIDEELALLASSDDDKDNNSKYSSLSTHKPKKREILTLSASWLNAGSSDSDDACPSKQKNKKRLSKGGNFETTTTGKSNNYNNDIPSSTTKKSSSTTAATVMSSHLADLMSKKYGITSVKRYSSDDSSDLSSPRKRNNSGRSSHKKRKKKPSDSSLDDSDSSCIGMTKKQQKTKKRTSVDDSSSDDDSAREKAKKRTQEEKESEKQRKAEERERLKLEKAELKRVEKEQKEREKELRKIEKEEAKKTSAEMKAANKLQDKKVAVTEMTINIDPNFVTAMPGGAKILDAVQVAGAKISMTPQPIASALQWTRTVTREWNVDRETWIPCPTRLEKEPYVLIRLAAYEFSKLIVSDGVSGCMSNIRRIYGPQYKPIVFIEGIKTLLKDRTKKISTQIQNQVRIMGGSAGGASRGVQNSTNGHIASKQEFDTALLWLQMFGDCFVQLSESPEETCGLIVSFTTSIAMIPERRSRSEQQLKLNFGDTVKSGETTKDCWRRILLEVKPLATAAAEIIVNDHYKTYRSLMDEYSRTPGNQREALLEDIEVNRITSNKRLGPRMSRKICLALTCEDESVAVFEAPPPKKMQFTSGGDGGGAVSGGNNHFQRANMYARGGGRSGRGGFRGRGGGRG